MTVPSYTEDLTDIATGDESVGWVELTGTDQDGETYNACGTPAYQDNEYPYIQGLYAVTQDTTKSTAIGSIAYSSGGVTVPTDGAILVWQNYSSPFAFGSYAQGGYRICVGSGLSDFNIWYVGGNDKSRMPYGGWENHAVNPNDPTGASESQLARDNYAGTTTTTKDYIGSAVYIVSGPSKGEPHQVDVIRYGRCSAIFEYGETSDYAVIAGFATQNDNQSNRWGLIQASPGGYLWKGRMQLGTATNAVDFRDSNKTIFIDWTPKVTINFNLIEIINDSSNVEMTGFTFLCLDTSTASPGRLLMTDQADVSLNSCTFIDMDTFVFSYDTTNTVDIDTCIFRRCGQVTQGGATFTDCTFDNSTAAVAVVATPAAIAEVTGSTFISDGTGHAVNLGTVSSTQSMTWNNTAIGYAASNGSTGNEIILVNVTSGITLTINVSTGASTPTYYNTGTGTVDVVAGTVTTQVTVKDAISKTAVEGAAVTIKAATTGPLPFEDTVTITRSGDIATVLHTGHGFSTGQKVEIQGAVQNEYNRIKTITVTGVDAYTYSVLGSPTTPATGTITATAIVIDGLTDASGQISDSRTLTSDQDITGKVQKGSTPPVYKPQDIATTIDSSNGVTLSFLLIAD